MGFFIGKYTENYKIFSFNLKTMLFRGKGGEQCKL